MTSPCARLSESNNRISRARRRAFRSQRSNPPRWTAAVNTMPTSFRARSRFRPWHRHGRLMRYTAGGEWLERTADATSAVADRNEFAASKGRSSDLFGLHVRVHVCARPSPAGGPEQAEAAGKAVSTVIFLGRYDRLNLRLLAVMLRP